MALVSRERLRTVEPERIGRAGSVGQLRLGLLFKSVVVRPLTLGVPERAVKLGSPAGLVAVG